MLGKCAKQVWTFRACVTSPCISALPFPLVEMDAYKWEKQLT